MLGRSRTDLSAGSGGSGGGRPLAVEPELLPLDTHAVYPSFLGPGSRAWSTHLVIRIADPAASRA